MKSHQDSRSCYHCDLGKPLCWVACSVTLLHSWDGTGCLDQFPECQRDKRTKNVTSRSCLGYPFEAANGTCAKGIGDQRGLFKTSKGLVSPNYAVTSQKSFQKVSANDALVQGRGLSWAVSRLKRYTAAQADPRLEKRRCTKQAGCVGQRCTGNTMQN